MASSTKQTEYRRKQRKQKAGRARKRQEQLKGTTPRFEIHSADAVKNAPKEQLPPSARD